MRVKVVILAAGQGKRFKTPYPKVLADFHGKPMVAWVVDAVMKSKVTDRPVIVVGVGADQVRQALGDRCDYVMQEPQLGTGHAVTQCQSLLEGKADAVLVLYGDQPLVTSATIRIIVNAHLRGQPTLTMATTSVPDFADWRRPLAQFGRIVRDKADRIERIVEVKDATLRDLEITEVNPSSFCLDGRWLWLSLKELTNRNTQGEYYLTDLVELAIQQGRKVETVAIAPEQALGANSPEDLESLEIMRQFVLDG